MVVPPSIALWRELHHAEDWAPVALSSDPEGAARGVLG